MGVEIVAEIAGAGALVVEEATEALEGGVENLIPVGEFHGLLYEGGDPFLECVGVIERDFEEHSVIYYLEEKVEFGLEPGLKGCELFELRPDEADACFGISAAFGALQLLDYIIEKFLGQFGDVGVEVKFIVFLNLLAGCV